MKILHLFPYLPTPANFGGAMRTFHILKHLVAHYDVTVAGYREFGDLDLFKKTFPELKGKMHFLNRPEAKFHRLSQAYSLLTPHSYWYNWAQSKQLERMLNTLLAEDDYQVVLSEFATMGHFNLKTDALRILDAHNVEYDNFRRMSTLSWSPIRKKFYQREYQKCYHEEIEIFNKQDAILTTSERDSEMIKKDTPGVPHFVIPNGVDTAYFETKGSEQEPFSMVFTGAMSYVPNYDGINFFLEKIFPAIQKEIPQAKIYIVGNNPPPILTRQSSESVIITGFVDDVRPFIDEASVYVVPLNMGSGTRLKVVEALSMKKPIVSTSIGCEGIDVEDGVHILIRDKPEEFARAVIDLMRNQQEQQRLIDNGYELVKKKYDWSVIGSAIDDAFDSLKAEKQWA